MFKHPMAARSRAAILACTVVAMGALSWVSAASAATVTETIAFRASDFYTIVPPGSVAQLDPDLLPVTGQVTVSFDPNVNVKDQTSAITLDDLNVPLASAIAFTYQALVVPPPAPPNLFYSLQFGGADLGTGSMASGFGDFVLDLVINPYTSGVFGPIFYYSPAGGLGSQYKANDVEAWVVTVPEPSTWALLIGGMAFVGGALRRSRRSAAAVRQAA